MNLGESLTMMTGLTSSAYNSILGNSLSQNILGSQISNSFGKKSDVFIDGIRLLEKIVLNSTTNLIKFESTKGSKRLEMAQKIASLGGYVLFTGLLERKNDEEGRKVWAGLTKMNVGDVAELNYMGDNLNVYRAVNRLTYNKPLKDDEDLADFEITQKKLLKFYAVLWGAALITSLVFVQYSVTVAVDQSLAENKEWQLANMAMQIAQIIALTYVGMYESKFLLDLATEERNLAYLDSNRATLQEFQIELNMLEERLQGQIDSLANQLNSWQATSKGDIEALTKEVQQQAKTIAENKKALQEQLQNEINELKQIFEKQIADLKEDSASKEAVEKFNKQLEALEKDIQDNKKNIEETQKKMDNALKKLEKKLSALETQVSDLEVTTTIEIEAIKEITGNVITVVQEVQEGVEDCNKRLDNTKRIKVSTLPGEIKRWFLGRERKKFLDFVVKS
jgi:hypothetical protein